MATPVIAPSPEIAALLDHLIQLGRQAWTISEQERAVRARINTLHEQEDGDRG